MTKVLEVRNLVKEFPGVKALQGVDLDVARGRGALPARPERRGQVDADQVRLRRGRADQRRDPVHGRAAAAGRPRRARSSAASRRSTRSSTSSPDLSVAESIFLGARAAPRAAARPRQDVPGVGGAARAARARVDLRCARRSGAAAGRAADRVDRARAVRQRAAADHGRAVGDPRRRRDQHALRGRSPAHRRGRRRRLHLAPPRRDPAHRRPRDRARRRPHDGERASRRRRRPTSSSSSWSGARSTSSIPERPVGTDEVLLEVRGRAGGCPPCAA